MLRRRLSSTNVWLLTEKPNAESVFVVEMRCKNSNYYKDKNPIQ